MDIESLKKEISNKMYIHSTSTSLYRKSYNTFNNTIDITIIQDENFLLSRSQFAEVAKRWNIKTNEKTINKLFNIIEPNADKIRYNQLVAELVN